MHHVGSHPGIVELKAAYENQHTLSLIMELCTGGDLFASIVALGRGGYSERKAAKLVREMLEAIRHCHSARPFGSSSCMFPLTGRPCAAEGLAAGVHMQCFRWPHI